MPRFFSASISPCDFVRIRNISHERHLYWLLGIVYQPTSNNLRAFTDWTQQTFMRSLKTKIVL